jgi:hypothetical protein
MLTPQEGDCFVTGAKSQAALSVAIKLGQTLRFQPGTARIATLAQLGVIATGILSQILAHDAWWIETLSMIAWVLLSVVVVWIVATLERQKDAYWANMNHAGVVVVNPDGELCLAEALARGVVYSPLSKYEPDNIRFIPSSRRMNVDDLARFRAFVHSVVEKKTRYGFVVFASLFVYCLTASLTFFPTLVLFQSGTSICSGFACDALTGPYRWSHESVFQMPANLWADLSERLGLRWP